MHKYEIEVKSLLGKKEEADRLISSLKKDTNLKLVGKGRQLNHYFNSPDDLHKIYNAVSVYIAEDKLPAFKKIVEEGKKVSTRTREADGRTLFIMKASVNDHSSQNGVSRIEFESETKGLNLNQLDKVLLDNGLTYQAKWSREREEYQTGDMHICIDKNAGYGYLAEFELIVDDEAKMQAAKDKILNFMEELKFSELPQDRLERMFSHYNKHWPEYYGTENIFVIE